MPSSPTDRAVICSAGKVREQRERKITRTHTTESLSGESFFPHVLSVFSSKENHERSFSLMFHPFPPKVNHGSNRRQDVEHR